MGGQLNTDITAGGSSDAQLEFELDADGAWRTHPLDSTPRPDSSAPTRRPTWTSSDGPEPRSQPDGAARRRSLLMTADLAAFAVGTAVAFALQAVLRPVPGFVVVDHVWLTLTSLPVFAFGASVSRLHLARANERRSEEFRNILKTVGIGLAWLVLLAFLAQYKSLSRFWVVAMAISVIAALVVERSIARSIFARLRRVGRIRRRIVIVGTDSHAIALAHAYERNPELGYDVAGFVGHDPLVARSDLQLLGGIHELDRVLEAHDAGGVVISLASIESAEVNYLTRQLTDFGYHVALSSSLHDIDLKRLRPQELDGRTMIYVEPTIRTGWRRVAKRAFDVVLATFVLLVTAPIHLVAAVAITLTSRGPVYFRQVRVGRGGELFQLIKLRTMVVDAEAKKAELASLNEADGPLFKMERDPRVTGVGRVLRKLSIDELPQLFCVLRGTMSMVGPRPALASEMEEWDDEVRDRLRVLPGLTGMWQVSGRSDSSFEQYKRLDLYYVDNWSLWHDVWICLKTVRVVLTGRGAS